MKKAFVRFNVREMVRILKKRRESCAESSRIPFADLYILFVLRGSATGAIRS